MTDLRQAAEMALEALELECTDINGNKVDLVNPAIEALRQALAESEREWVGLTDNEMESIWDITPPEYEDRFAFARAVEAKLKEKNIR